LVDLLSQAEPWDRYNRGKPINPYQLAQLLSRFRIRPQVIRFEDKVQRGYYVADFTEAFERYL